MTLRQEFVALAQHDASLNFKRFVRCSSLCFLGKLGFLVTMVLPYTCRNKRLLMEPANPFVIALPVTVAIIFFYNPFRICSTLLYRFV